MLLSSSDQFVGVYGYWMLVFGLQMRRWKAWEDQTKTIEYQYSHGN